MKFLFTLLLSLILIACELTNGPEIKDGAYVYSHIESESLTVYAEGGEIVPETDWKGDIATYVTYCTNEMNNELETMKEFTMELKDNKIYTPWVGEIAEFPYKMKGDTIVILLDFSNKEVEMPIALKIDNNTIEYISYSFGIHWQPYSEYKTGSYLADYKHWLDYYTDYANNTLPKDAYVTINVKHLRYVHE